MNVRSLSPDRPDLLEPEPLWDALVAQSSDFVGLMDESGIAVFMNRSVRGANQDAVEGKPLEDFLSPERARQVRAMLVEARTSGLPVVNDALRIEALDGAERWFIEKCIPVPRPNGTLHFMLIRTETTHLRKAQQELGASEQRYRTLFDSNPDPVLVVEASTLAIMAANPAAVRLYGWSEAELRERAWCDLFLDGQDALRQRFQANLAEERRGIARQLRRDGASVTAEIVDNPIVFAGIAARIAVVRDVTEREHLEEQLRHAQKMEAMGVFAGGVAHDFNNLLTVIAGCTRSVRDDTPSGTEASEDLEHVLDAVARGSNLTKKLMLFSRRLVLNVAPIDLTQVINDFAGMLQRLLGDRIKLDIRHAAATVPLNADRTELEQLVLNLVLNAQQAMPSAGQVIMQTSLIDLDEALAAQYPGAKAGRFAELCVSDDGHGMNAGTLARVFEPFFTTKPDGTGLGLAVVHGVVERHHGFIRAESKPGSGTTIRVYLPLSPEVPLVVSALREAPRGSERVLVVEDEPLVRMLTERSLRRLGYQVVSACDGEEAVQAFEREPDAFDLVVMDVVMPKLGGREAFDRMRTRRPRLKVLFVTGYAPETTGMAAIIGQPGLRLLQKPFTSVELGEQVRYVMEH